MRLVLPGYEGNMWVKWLRRIEVGDRPWFTRWETRTYTDLMPDGLSRQFTFVNEVNSVITYPCPEKPLHGKPGFVEITGLAWSGAGRITRVDVSVDGGDNWRTAELQEPVLPKALTRFRILGVAGRASGLSAIARDGRNRAGAAHHRRAARRTRRGKHLPQEQHPHLAGRRRRDGGECPDRLLGRCVSAS